jgi:response regulator RpfG family c-di-GMP phosphodiesterase
MKTPTRFIVIDDDLVSNMLCKLVINEAKSELEIKTFNIPETGFKYISREYFNNKIEISTVLLLDINMPTWTGWDFLDNFEMLDKKIKEQIRIYMLSSSVDPKDKLRARENKNVVDYIVKPLSKKIVLAIIINPGF